MQAIILVGGFGTRLQSVVPDVPKPMAPIQDKPFLAYLLDMLHAQGVRHVIFSVHYLREIIEQYFKNQYRDITIHYAVESTPLGTGGAMKHAMQYVNPAQPVWVLNGDTYVEFDAQAMWSAHQAHAASLTMALRQVSDCARYGKVVVHEETIIGFAEKGEAGFGLINAGVYLLNPAIFDLYPLPQQFSFEQDFMIPHVQTLKPTAYLADGYFIDIGIPEDYARAFTDLPALAVCE